MSIESLLGGWAESVLESRATATAIGLMRICGVTNIAAACRRFSAKPWLALKLMGFKT